MKSSGFWPGIVIVVLAAIPAVGQSEPNLEIGFKPYGSYHGSEIDSLSLLNGNVIHHIPLPMEYPQRGGRLNNSILVVNNSKNWSIQSQALDDGQTQTTQFFWAPGVSSRSDGPMPPNPGGITWTLWPVGLQRSVFYQGTTTAIASFYSLMTWDGASHALTDTSGNGSVFESLDASGWRVVMGNQNSTNQLYGSATLVDREGNQFFISQIDTPGTCTQVQNSKPAATQCIQSGAPTTATDANGNVYGANGVLVDTLGRSIPGATGSAVNTSVCGSSSSSIASATAFPYAGFNGANNQIIFCNANLNIATSFGVTASGTGVQGVAEYPNTWAQQQGFIAPSTLPVMILLPDGSKWTFSYDSYGDVTNLGLPLGGSISYQYATVAFPVISTSTSVSRAVRQRTITDNNGNTYTWKYQWVTQITPGGNGTPPTNYTNVVTDPLGNDTVHVFTIEGSSYFETNTLAYQGASTSGQLLRRVDTTYQVFPSTVDTAGASPAVLPIKVQTTVYPSRQVTLVEKTYDSALPLPANSKSNPGSTSTYGTLLMEKAHDWGQGSPGAVLRETDTTYVWQNNSNYLSANMLDFPSAVVTKDGSGNKLAETDSTYDESSYLTTYTAALPAGTHVAAPNGSVRGNPTTVSRWLNTSSNPVVSHTNWYDTGEPYQQIDALGHATAHSYDPYYAGAYATETCNALSQCVSATYDFTTGLLTSFTNANATRQASGNTPGDAAHTSNYGYDFMSRMTSAAFPPDPGSGGAQAQTTFQYPNPISLPFTVTKTRSITSSLSDSATSYFDGLGRVYKTLHPLANGTAEVDTGYDGLDHVVSVTNPYFSTSDPTYGVMQTQFDGLGRTTQVTRQDGSVSTVAYDYVPIQSAPGDCTKTTDEAGKQRLTCSDGVGRLIEVHEPGDSFSGTPSQGSFSIGGSLQSHVIPGTNATTATGSVTINGLEQSVNITTQVCLMFNNNGDCTGYKNVTTVIHDKGTVSITVNGTAYSYSYGQNDTTSTIASALASAINGGSLTSASASGATISLTAKSSGAVGNYSLSASDSYDTTDFSSPSFTASTSGSAMTGGTNGVAPATVYDQGTVTVTVGSFTANAAYSQSGNSTAAQVAAALAGNGSTGLSRSGSPVTASASGSTLTINYSSVGTAGNVTVGCSSATSVTQYFFGPSFTCPSSTALSGGYNPEGPSLDFNYFVTQYSYDGLGNLLNVTQKGDPSVSSQGQWRTRTFTYNSLSQLLTATNPESGQISYSYDANGNVLQKTSPAPNQTGSATQTLSYCYDALNRVTGKAYSAQTCSNGLLPSGTAVVSYGYDAGVNGIGHLTSLSDQAGSGSYSYDVLGRIASEQRTIAGNQKNLSYTYNLDHSVASLTYPSGAVVTYTPDSAGRVLSAIDSGDNINYVTGATYGPDSSLTGFVSGNSSSFAGITNLWQYNTRLQICRITALTTGTLPKSCTDSTDTGNLLDLGYNMNLGAGDNGNVAAITNYKDSTRSQSFTYDALNRLTSAQNAGTNCSQKTAAGATEYWGNSYGYDAWGNLLNKTVTKCSAENLSVTALANNQLSNYGYDAAGNMTHDASTGNNYTFDQENRITGAAGYTYTYDADGNRVEKSNGSTGTIYWYMTPGIVAESDLSGNLKSEYVFFDGERVARRDLPAGSVSYYFSDHLKTASVITNASGTITEDEDYYPWGGEIQFVNNDSNHYKFTGKERDAETGLDYFGARYYGNWLGRFISADWAAKPEAVPYSDLDDPQSLNLYSYVRNVPTSRADPDGHCCLDAVVDFLAGAANAWGSDNLAGAGRVDQTTTAGKIGAFVGDLGATVQGALETGVSAAGEGVGVTLDATGVGVVAGVPINAVSTAGLIHGSVTTATAGTNLMKDVTGGNSGSNPPNPDGSKGAPDHQAKVNELVDKAQGEAKAGETVESNKQVKGLDSTRRPDAQIVNAQGKTRKVFEAERHPTRQRNKKREAEYKKLKVKQETHPVN